jgi:acetate---CoA ligase (ADP-forming)
MPKDLRPLLDPETVAVIGASAAPHKPGHSLLRNVLDGGFEGRIYPINPKGGEIAGLPAYASIGDVPETVDLAFIVLGRKHVLGAVEACAAAGTRAVCIVTAGFAEGDPWGREEQARITAVAEEHGIIAIGPNTIGTISMGGRLLGSFVPFPHWEDGNVAIVAQTGIYAGAVALELMSQETQRIGITASVDIGNRVGIDELDLLEELAARDEAEVLGFYLEAFSDARTFLRRAAEVKRDKPIVVLKPGRTQAGARASASHTGSLAQDDAVVQQLLAQHGIIRADDSEEFLAFLKALSGRPDGAGDRVGVVTYSGALGVMATDRLVMEGLTIAEPAGETKAAIEALMPDWQSAGNPADLWSAVEVDPRASVEVGFGAMLADPGVDQVLGVLLAVPNADFDGFGDAMARLRAEHPGKPVHLVMHGAVRQSWMAQIDHLGIPVYASVAQAVRAVATLARRQATRDDMPEAHAVPDPAGAR